MNAKSALRGLRQLDKLIEDLYYKNCAGVQIDVMDIHKVFEAGRTAAYSKGPMVNLAAVEAAIIATVNQIRRN